MSRLRIGVFGAGHLGKIHLRCLQQLEEMYDVVGFFDPDNCMSEEVVQSTGLFAFANEEALLKAVDVVDIVAPTVHHYYLAKAAIIAGKHVFIEKPVTTTMEEAKSLLLLQQEMGVCVQIGHVERFNPAYQALQNHTLHPMFIEGHRLATFNPRGTDVSVVLDLMIHDIDVVLSLVPSAVKSIQASGVAVLSNSPDIANARIEFENGCVANLTASRISMKQMRKLRFFQKDAYISLDFLEKETQIIRLLDGDTTPPDDLLSVPLETPDGNKQMVIEMPKIQAVNAIQEELRSFGKSINHGTPVEVSLEQGANALKVALDILADIKTRLSKK